MRDPATRADRWQIVCPICFVDLAYERGIDGSWHFAPHGLDLESIWDDADGRVWNADRCRWNPPDPLESRWYDLPIGGVVWIIMPALTYTGLAWLLWRLLR